MEFNLMLRLCLLIAAFLPCMTYANEMPNHQVYPCNIESAAQTIAFAQGTLLICYFGSTPEQKNNGWISVAGVAFHRLLPSDGNKQEFIAEADELGLGIDYRIVNGTLEIVYFFDTYPAFKAVPFYKDTINLNKLPSQHQRQLVYKPLKVSTSEFNSAISFLEINESQYSNLYQHKHGAGLIYENLFKLREYSFLGPKDVAAELGKMEHYWWSHSGGEIEEVFHAIQNDVSIIYGIKSGIKDSDSTVMHK